MAEPLCAQTSPYVLELEPGDYFWCACGRSRNQPFCDGSHAGTGITPLMFTVDEKRKRGYCGCKQTATPPFCDGSHKDVAG